MQFAMNMLKQNPNVVRNPQAQAMLQVLQSGDAQKGQQIVQNLCQTYGITPEEAVKPERLRQPVRHQQAQRSREWHLQPGL